MPHDQKNEYLGDGVYASFDGYQIWLAVNHHENKVIALDPRTCTSLENYIKQVFNQNTGEKP